MLEASPRWNRQRLAVLEAVNHELKRLFSILYVLSATSASVYMAGWLCFNMISLSIDQLPYTILITSILTAVAGVLHAALLPAIAIALCVENVIQNRIKRNDRTKETARLQILARSGLSATYGSGDV